MALKLLIGINRNCIFIKRIMSLKEALRNISAKRYFQVCGYSYVTIYYYQDREYKDLPKDFQDGIKRMILNLLEVQKMVYSYEIDLVVHYMKLNGIKLQPFFLDSEVDCKTFHRTLSLNKHRDQRLMSVRLELMRTVNRLLEYSLPPS